MNTPLTKKQADFLSFLKKYLQERGYPPTVRESMDGLGLSSTNIVKKILRHSGTQGIHQETISQPTGY